MTKVIDLNKSVYELTEEYPEVIEIMAQLGFTEISKKPMRLSVGKIITIPKGSKMKNIPMEDILAAFAAQGFEVTGVPEEEQTTTQATTYTTAAPVSSMQEPISSKEKEAATQTALVTTKGSDTTEQADRTEQIKGYLRRLSAGEDLETVRADFAQEFASVDASEIMNAEQGLLAEGTPLEEVQKLCDVHSALFHGKTADEMLANVNAVLDTPQASGNTSDTTAAASAANAAPLQATAETASRAAELAAIPGHPLHTFTRENEAIGTLLAQFKGALAQDEETSDLLHQARKVAIHYAKKGDLLFPLLKVKYGITGPSEVMWTVDDEIRDELGALAKEDKHDEWWNTRLQNTLTRAEEMIYKEENILFPICAENFTEEEWVGIYQDSKDYDVCLGVEPETWTSAETAQAQPLPAHEGEIVMPGGHVTVEQLTAFLNTIPMEISFVDADNINRYFNEGPKVFKRPGMAIDREVFSCHPPKIEPMVRAIIDDFRAGTRDQVPVWMEKNGRTMLVTYNAVRDANGTYLGTMELVQDMEFAKEHFCPQD